MDATSTRKSPSWQARLLSQSIRALVRRRNWGDERQLARRARLLFGSPPIYRSVVTIGVAIEPFRDEGIDAEWLTPSNAQQGVIFYVHGGGFVSCSRKTHRPLTSALARHAQCRVLSVDYRLAPENRFPNAIDDVVSAYEWMLRSGVDPSSVAFAGDSAGGNLALSLALRLRDARRPMPSSIVVFSPWTDLAGSGQSIKSNDGRCAMFRTENISQFGQAYLGKFSADSPKASPMYANLAGLPPVLFHVGSTELLLDDSRVMHQRLIEAGGESHMEVFNDLPHGWQMLAPFVPESTQSLKSAAAFIQKNFQIS